MFLIMFSSLSIYFYFFIPIESHNVFKSKLVHIDLFLADINSFHIDTDTLVLDHHAHFSSHTATDSCPVGCLSKHL